MSNGNRGEGRDQGQGHGESGASDRPSQQSRSESPSANHSASLKTKARRRRSTCRLLRRPSRSWCGRPRQPTQSRDRGATNEDLTRGNARARTRKRAGLFISAGNSTAARQARQQSARRHFAQVEHTFEILDAAVIRVGHFELRRFGREFKEQRELRGCALGAGAPAPRDWRGPLPARS